MHMLCLLGLDSHAIGFIQTNIGDFRSAFTNQDARADHSKDLDEGKGGGYSGNNP